MLYFLLGGCVYLSVLKPENSALLFLRLLISCVCAANIQDVILFELNCAVYKDLDKITEIPQEREL